jgi:AcrR family transcriptional regulator
VLEFGATMERPTRRRADTTRTKILDAALDLFSEHSFDGASTRNIAAAAGVTQPLVTYHFTTKEALWTAVVDRLFAELASVLDQRREGLRGVDAVTTARLLVREFILFSAANPQLHRIITQEAKAGGERMDWLVERHVRPLFDATLAMLEPLIDAAAVPALAPHHLYYVLTGAGTSMFVLAPEATRLTGIDVTAPDEVAAYADGIVALLFDR